jgi:hypothetical protein
LFKNFLSLLVDCVSCASTSSGIVISPGRPKIVRAQICLRSPKMFSNRIPRFVHGRFGSVALSVTPLPEGCGGDGKDRFVIPACSTGPEQQQS